MKNEERLLISICQSYFSGNCPDCSDYLDEIDWEQLFSLAKSHNQLGICQCVFSKYKEQLNIPDDTAKLFTECFFDLVYIYEMQTRALGKIKTAFEQAQLPLVAFKGAHLRTLYPVPESRSMGDIDLLISSSDSEAAVGIMRSLGFDLASSNATVDEYTDSTVLVEIHTRLTDEYDGIAFDDAFEHTNMNGFAGELEDSYHLAYLIAHLAHHFKYKGAGIGLVLDLAVMLREGSVDLEQSFSYLERIGLASFGRAILSLCYELFGYGVAYSGNTERIKEYLVSYGVFGTRYDSVGRNTADDTVSRLREFGAYDGKKQSPLVLKLRMAFPPYSALRKATYIKFLNGRPYLLPLAWCYRLFYNLLHRREHIVSAVKNIDDERTAHLAKEELKFFEEIGLI